MKMNNKERVFKAISIALEVKEEVLSEDTAIGDFPNWDSMGHLIIISELEKEFDIKFDPEDIMEFRRCWRYDCSNRGYTNV